VNLTLARLRGDGSRTFGMLTIPGTLTLLTLELPWIPDPMFKGGSPGRSCVPAGLYQLVTHDTPAHPKTWALVSPDLAVYHEPMDIPIHGMGRTACLLHTANLVNQLAGCIAVGDMPGVLTGEVALLDSGDAFGRLKALVPWINHTLLITEWAGGV
jgi:Family of unknown function (DUF5675)